MRQYDLPLAGVVVSTNRLGRVADITTDDPGTGDSGNFLMTPGMVLTPLPDIQIATGSLATAA